MAKVANWLGTSLFLQRMYRTRCVVDIHIRVVPDVRAELGDRDGAAGGGVWGCVQPVVGSGRRPERGWSVVLWGFWASNWVLWSVCLAVAGDKRWEPL